MVSRTVVCPIQFLFKGEAFQLRHIKHDIQKLARFLKISTFMFCKTLLLKISTNLKNKHKMVTLALGESEAMLPWKNLHAANGCFSAFRIIFRQILFKFLTLILSASQNYYPK